MPTLMSSETMRPFSNELFLTETLDTYTALKGLMICQPTFGVSLHRPHSRFPFAAVGLLWVHGKGCFCGNTVLLRTSEGSF